MRAAGQNPGGAGRLEIGLAFPHRAGHRQFRQGWVVDRIDFVHEQAEAIAQINEARIERRACRRVEHQAHRIFLAADAKRMDLQRRLARRDRRADLQHVRAEHQMAAGSQVVGVVLHERRAARQPLAHDLHRAHQRGGFPVALAGEAVAIGHQPLRREAGQLPQPVQIFERGREALEAAVRQEGAHAQFEPRAIEQRLVPRAPFRAVRPRPCSAPRIHSPAP